jgi:hypothetical protein
MPGAKKDPGVRRVCCIAKFRMNLQQTQQQIGMPFIIMYIVQPGIIMLVMQSQHAWIILRAIMSPLVQVIMHPMSIISILQVPMGIMHWQHIMPFIMQHMPIIPFAFIMHICCIMPAAVLSSHVIVHFMPSGIRSIFMVQRGSIIPFIPLIIDGMAPIGVCIPIGIPIIPIRSPVIIVFINVSNLEVALVRRGARPGEST